MKNKQAHDHLTRARTTLLLDQFFFGRLALYLKLEEDTSIPTLAVDGKHIFYNPDFVLTLSPQLTMSAICHEIGHCIFEHIHRRGSRLPHEWNCAGDYVINEMLEKSGFQLGSGWLRDKQYDGMSAEHVYDLLMANQKDQPPLEPLCTILDASDSQAEMVENAMEWKIAVTQAADGAKKHGKLPAGFERFVNDITTPKVPWREVLARFVTQIAHDDYTWSRPNRRYISRGIFLPSLHSECMGRIDVVIDTSGSIDQPTLNAFGTEIQAIVNAVRPEKTRVIYCDAAINHIDEFSPNDELKFKAHGGGGTDFCPPFRLIASEDEKPACLVYLTDMMGNFPKEPDFPTLWCATTDRVGPFGETVRIEV